jgi:site-specific DNA-adenine methylase
LECGEKGSRSTVENEYHCVSKFEPVIITTIQPQQMEIIKPFMKWVGGKTQIMNYMIALFPKEMNNYHEPFLGGGSVLLALLSYRKSGSIKISGKIYASDLNSNLIGLYKNIQSDPPYAPESGTSFVSYTSDGFNLDNHKMLFKLCADMKAKNVKILMSNADVKMVKDAFPSPTYTTKIINCRRAIHSKKPDARTNEVLIIN